MSDIVLIVGDINANSYVDFKGLDDMLTEQLKISIKPLKI